MKKRPIANNASHKVLTEPQYLGEEKRRYDRIQTLLPIVYSDGKRFLKEFVHDVSAGGLMIKSSQPCGVGTILDMSVDFNPTIRAKGTVVWMKQDNGWYNIGVQLKEIKPSAAPEWADFLNRSLGLTPYAKF